MGSFANTLFSVLLGWVQSAAAWVWQLFATDGEGGMLGWLMDNWLPLAVLVCVLGLLIDLVVYLIRWQPYRVWRSRMHREDAVEEAILPLDDEEESLQWLYANGETVEEPHQPLQDAAAPQEEPRLQTPVKGPQRVIPARRRRAADGSVEYVLPSGGNEQQGYHQPYYPPQWRERVPQETDGGTKE